MGDSKQRDYLILFNALVWELVNVFDKQDFQCCFQSRQRMVQADGLLPRGISQSILEAHPGGRLVFKGPYQPNAIALDFLRLFFLIFFPLCLVGCCCLSNCCQAPKPTWTILPWALEAANLALS